MPTVKDKLQAIRERDLYRARRIIDSAQGPVLEVEGSTYLSFCSNDYLGLAADARLVEAAAQASLRYGAGAGASHLVSGHMRVHHELEQALASFVGAKRALLFSTGYMANLGVMAALLNRHGLVIEDKLNHASLIDAARLSGARVARYRHGDVDALSRHIDQGRQAAARLIASDAVFSMDGDYADLAALNTLARESDSWLLIDDAHGFGVRGDGRGSLAAAGLTFGPHTIYMGTLGKAAGSFGAFVAGSDELIEMLIQSARTYIYTTALPPAVAVTSLAALRIIQDEPARRTHLAALIARFRIGCHKLGLSLMPSDSAIQPIVLGRSIDALIAADHLREQGIWVPAIREPTVPRGTARLRVSLSAAHSEAMVDKLLDALATLPGGSKAPA